jgi:phage shock protein A
MQAAILVSHEKGAIMGIFGRLSDLLSANIHALLDRAEDPEKMLAHVIRDMEHALVTVRGQAARAIAARRRLEREHERAFRDSNYWKEQAQRALAHNREDLARSALARKIERADAARALEPELATARQATIEVKNAVRALETRLAEVHSQESVLLARHYATRACHDARRAVSRGGFDLQGSIVRFEHFASRLADFHDDLQAQIELIQPAGDVETELADLDLNKRIDLELAALKGPKSGPEAGGSAKGEIE